jgi:hypothetical protein
MFKPGGINSGNTAIVSLDAPLQNFGNAVHCEVNFDFVVCHVKTLLLFHSILA